MNDFTELENELKKLRPSQPSAELVARIDAEFRNQKPDPHLHPLPQGEADAERRVRVTHSTSGDTGKVIRPSRFKVSWIALGAGLAAAAIFLIFARIDTDQASRQTNRVTQNTPAPAARAATVPTGYIPDGATHVVYHTQDEGLHYRAWSEAPVRRVRTQKRETLQWRDAQTGASLQVSYPTEEVVLTPVSGQ